MKTQSAETHFEKITDRVIPPEFKNKIKILVVEDNPLNQKMASFMLEDWGYKHHICSNGKLAIENFRFNKYDLVLMDIQMPELNGFETVKYIHDTLKQFMPIIAMSAHGMSGEKAKCLSAGMTDYIAKPINEVELFNKITNYLYKCVVEAIEI